MLSRFLDWHFELTFGAIYQATEYRRRSRLGGGGWDGEDDEVYYYMVSLEALGAGAVLDGDRSLMQAEFLAGLRVVSK